MCVDWNPMYLIEIAYILDPSGGLISDTRIESIP